MNRVLLAASGDARLPANQLCWPTQKAMEDRLVEVIQQEGWNVERVHPYDADKGHGFLDSQQAGLAAFSKVDRQLPVIVAESVWQYSHHVLPGLLMHKGPILTVANWSGQWPGLVGMLNLNGGLTKARRNYSSLWSETFEDEFFLSGLRQWLEAGSVVHDLSHCRPYTLADVPERCRQIGDDVAGEIKRDGAILAVFDEGCMGMYNAIIPDEILAAMGVFKERLSQSALLFEMSQVTDQEAEDVFGWLMQKGFNFHFGPDPDTDLTKDQVLQQCRMYIAAARMADEFGAAALGIQYQLGLKDMCPASDLAEGLLNNSERPPVRRRNGTIILPDAPYPHFNEVDECAGLDALLTDRVHYFLQQPRESTLHDLRWADWDQSGTVEDYVWVFEISGAAPPAHHVRGYAGSHGYRQPSMYFPAGGSTLSGTAKPGEIVWSRIYVDGPSLRMDIGRGHVVELPEEETRRRLDGTTPVWPIMHAVLHGVTRDQMMAKHKANHVQVAYADSPSEADKCLHAKACAALDLGIEVNLCGTLSQQ